MHLFRPDWEKTAPEHCSWGLKGIFFRLISVFPSSFCNRLKGHQWICLKYGTDSWNQLLNLFTDWSEKTPKLKRTDSSWNTPLIYPMHGSPPSNKTKMINQVYRLLLRQRITNEKGRAKKQKRRNKPHRTRNQITKQKIQMPLKGWHQNHPRILWIWRAPHSSCDVHGLRNEEPLPFHLSFDKKTWESVRCADWARKQIP